jgi:hypothetical protein
MCLSQAFLGESRRLQDFWELVVDRVGTATRSGDLPSE